MPNARLGGGDEEMNGLLAGFNPTTDDGLRATARGAVGIVGVPIIEAIARIASVVISGGEVGGGSGSGCAWVDAWLPSGRRVGHAVAGDELEVLTEDGLATTKAAVRASQKSMQPCVTLVTESGIRLTCSLSTPITIMRDGGLATIDVEHCLGALVAVLDEQGFRWEPIVVKVTRGRLPVQLIDGGGVTFAAGDRLGRYIFTHNKLTSPRGGG